MSLIETVSNLKTVRFGNSLLYRRELADGSLEVLAMGYLRRLLVGAVGAVSLVGAGAVGVSAHEGGQLIQFDSMTPVTGSAGGTGDDPWIKGRGLPWVVTSGHGDVRPASRLSV